MLVCCELRNTCSGILCTVIVIAVLRVTQLLLVTCTLPFFFSLSLLSSVCTHGVLLSMSQQVYVMI